MTAIEAYFVTRTMRAIELLSRGPRSMVELATALQIHERTAGRTLWRLRDEGYVARRNGSSGPWILTERLSTISVQALFSGSVLMAGNERVVDLDGGQRYAVVIPLQADLRGGAPRVVRFGRDRPVRPGDCSGAGGRLDVTALLVTRPLVGP